jgi:creatinine amidohydrolase
LDVRSVISDWIAKQLDISLEDPHFLIFPVKLPEEPRPSHPDDVHAGKYMTATMYKHYSALMDLEKTKRLVPTTLSYDEISDWTKGGEITKNMTPSGYFGDPASFADVHLDF